MILMTLHIFAIIIQMLHLRQFLCTRDQSSVLFLSYDAKIDRANQSFEALS